MNGRCQLDSLFATLHLSKENIMFAQSALARLTAAVLFAGLAGCSKTTQPPLPPKAGAVAGLRRPARRRPHWAI
jgi:hypothetical protein